MVVKNLTMFGSILGYSIVGSATGWGLFGALAGSGFGLVLTAIAGRRRLQELSFWRTAVLGGVIGVGLSFGLSFLTGPPLASMSLVGVLSQATMGGAFGMLLGSGSVAVAKEAENRELLSTSDASLLLELPEDL